MTRKSTVDAVTAIGMDMGKTTLHMVGLDSHGAIVLREKVSRGRIASRLAGAVAPTWRSLQSESCRSQI
jgi:transposase